jgi:diguanylate cyclase (GGDEF)-like protein
MTPAAAPELALSAGALIVAAAATLVALRARARARASALAFRVSQAHARTFAESSRAVVEAARCGSAAVREAIAVAVRATAPAVDAILLYDEADGALVCVFAAGERVKYFAGSQVALGDPRAPAARAVAASHRVTLADRGVAPAHPGDAAIVAMPLALEGGRTCALVACARLPLDAAAVERVVALAEAAVPAYAIARERDDDRQRAEYDGLTGLLTPRAFRQRLTALVERARFDQRTRLALLFVDTDRFKEWNDAYGHASGDALLREIARVLRTVAAGRQDLVARNGGDEFCIVLEAAKAEAIERAELVRRHIAALDVRGLRPAGAQADVRITASLGVAVLFADAATASELLERADAAMYHAKQTGRDGVCYLSVHGELTRLGPLAGAAAR